MTKGKRWTLGILLAVAGLVALGFWLMPSDEEVAARIKEQAQAKLGVEVTLGAVHWEILPTPVLVILDAATVQPQPISFKRIVARLNFAALRRRQLSFVDVLVDGGVMPQLSLRGLHIEPSPQNLDTTQPVVEQLRFRNLTWITRHGNPLEFDGHFTFDALWRPRQGEVVRPGVKPLTQITLNREGDADRWQVTLLLGGGTANGHVALQSGEDGTLKLSGELEPRNIDVDSAMTAFKRHSAVSGKASGHTQLSASGATVAELARSLHTRTTFSVAGARLLHMDVDKAIRSAGTDRAGQTPLQSLTGQMDTQNTTEGMVVRFSAIQAKGESFSARGGGTIANRHVNGEVTVDLAGGLIGVPLKIDGPLEAPHISVPASAVAGAAAGAVVGTVVLPGIGTAIGASVGAAIGKMFKGSDAKSPNR